MRIITTGDWHLGNLFHGNDRLQEHIHFLKWLENTIVEQNPDVLLVAGDVFDNGNPSAASQTAYYDFLAEITKTCPELQIVITAGNHDSASRLEAPRPLLTRHNVEIRGNLKRRWVTDKEGGHWEFEYDDLLIPVTDKDGNKTIIIAVPYLRNDVVQNASYSDGVNRILRDLTARARELYPDTPIVMMAHMYAKGADIVKSDASERIIIGGQEEVDMDGWADHPDYLTCGHIHKRQQICDTNWARYTGSILPMSFSEEKYQHGVDLVTIDSTRKPQVEFLEYIPQHKLRILPADDQELTPKKMEKLIKEELRERVDGKLSDHYDYLLLKVKLEKFDNDELAALYEQIAQMDVILCKMQKLVPTLDLTTIVGQQKITSIDDILERDPMDTLKETFTIRHNADMTEHQQQMLKDLLDNINNNDNQD